MTQLRDARLQRALQAAPDADAVPADTTRRAVRDAALRAIQPAARATAAPWWRRWFGDSEQRMRWNAALATVLIAGFVTVLWQGEEVPDARPEASRGDAAIPAAPATEPAPAADPPPATAVAPSVARVSPAAAATAPAARPAPASKPPAMSRDFAKPPDAALQKRAAEDLAAGRARGTPEPAPVPEDSAAAQAAARMESREPAQASAPQSQVAQLAPTPPSAAPATRASVRAMAPSPAAAPAAAPMAREASPQLQPAAADWRQWSELRISSAGRSVVVPREARMAQLAGQVQAQATAPSSGEPAQWRMEFLAQGSTVALLELAAGEARWAVRGQALRSSSDAALLRALQDEAQRLLPR